MMVLQSLTYPLLAVPICILKNHVCSKCTADVVKFWEGSPEIATRRQIA